MIRLISQERSVHLLNVISRYQGIKVSMYPGSNVLIRKIQKWTLRPLPRNCRSFVANVPDPYKVSGGAGGRPRVVVLCQLWSFCCQHGSVRCQHWPVGCQRWSSSLSTVVGLLSTMASLLSTLVQFTVKPGQFTANVGQFSININQFVVIWSVCCQG